MPRRTVVSLFTGCGGLDFGLEAAGFRPIICVESDGDCRETLRRSVNWRLSEPGDIAAIAPKEILRQAGVRKRQVDVVAGGPPCQPFSKAGFWRTGESRRMGDPRSDTLKRYFEVVEAALPRVVLLENVAGLAYEGMDEGLRYCVEAFEAINERCGTRYRPTLLHINAADFGIPQVRHRVFIIAERTGQTFVLPSPTHISEARLGDPRPTYLSAWDAIGDLDRDRADLPTTGKWADLIPSIPEGQNYLWHTVRGGGEPLFGWRTRYWSFLLKLAKTKPSWTIQASPGPATGPFHWRNRRLSVTELRRLQTMPGKVRVFGEYRSAHRQLGNAIPSALGELLGLEIRRQFFGERVRKKLTLIPRKRRHVPQAAAVSPVDEKFQTFIFHRPDHPGEGYGPRGRRRNGDEAQIQLSLLGEALDAAQS